MTMTTVVHTRGRAVVVGVPGEPRPGEDQNVFYYLTLYNEPIPQPAEPDPVDVDGILAGMHCYSPAPDGDGPTAQILASGIAMPWALDAQRLLHTEWESTSTYGR